MEFYNTLEHIDLSEETYHVLKEKILQRQLKPGIKISINEVTEGLGVSRTPVVIALQRLAGEGLVDINPRRGTVVKGITIEEIEGVFEVRRMMELYAVQYILENGLVQNYLDEVAHALDLMEKATSGEEFLDYESFIQGDREFHSILIRQLDNQRIIHIYDNLNVHIHVARAHYVNDVESARQSQSEHAVLIEALLSGNLVTVKSEINTHIDNVKSRIVQLIKEEGGQI